MGGPLPAGRATRGLTWMVVGALALIGGRWYFGQRFGLAGEIERVLRAQYLPQIEKQFGAPVEIGAVDTDWLGRVTVHDVVIGRDAALPTGALAQVRTVTISLDLPGLALGRARFPGAIRAVALDAPQIYLRRDRAGFNWSRLLSGSRGASPTKWSGHVSVANGRVYYLDSVLPSASGRPLIVDARGISASLDALADAPYRFAARAALPLLGAPGLALRPIAAQGAFDAGKNALVSVQTESVPLAPLGDFAFPKRDVVVRGGEASGRLQLALRGSSLLPSGAISVRNGAVTLARARVPGLTQPLQIGAITGPIRFADRAFSSTGARFTALGSEFSVAGAASLNAATSGAPRDNASTPIFDVRVTTAALPIAPLRPFLPRGTAFSSGAVRLNAHFAGTPRQLSADGNVEAPQAQLSDATRGWRGTFASLRANFVATTASATTASAITAAPKADAARAASAFDWRFAARFAAPGVRLETPQGRAEASLLTGSARAGRGGGADFEMNAPNFTAQSPRYGAMSAALRFAASTPDLTRPNWRGGAQIGGASTSALRLAAFSPSLARVVRQSGTLDIAARFSNLTSSESGAAASSRAIESNERDAKAFPSKAPDGGAPNSDGRGTKAFDADALLTKARVEATVALSRLQLNPQALGANRTLPLSEADSDLRDLRGHLSLAGGQLRVARASARSSFGLLRLDAAWPLRQPQAARLALTLPAVRFGAARLATLARAQGLALDGDWRGRVSLLSGAGDGRYGLDFDLNSDGATLRGLGRGGARVVLDRPRLRGRAEFAGRTPSQSWSAVATLSADAARARGGTLGTLPALPAQASGASASGVRFDLNARASNAPPMMRAAAVPAPRALFAAPRELDAAHRASSDGASCAAEQKETATALAPSSAPLGASASPKALLATSSSSAPVWAGALRVQRCSAPVAGGRGAFVTLSDARAQLVGAGGGVRVPRLSARFGAARLDGTARVERGNFSARVLARGVDLARVQRLMAPASLDRARLSGSADAALQITPGAPPRAQIQLAHGVVRAALLGAAPLALQEGRAQIEVDAGALRVRGAQVWSDGARLSGNFALARGRWGGNVSASGLRLARLAAWLGARRAAALRPDGLLSGDFAFASAPDGSDATLSGEALVQMATFAGASLPRASARVSASNGARGWRLGLSELRGQIEDAPFAGQASADLAANRWQLSLQTSDLNALDLARLGAVGVAAGAERVRKLERALPVSGALSAEVALSGTLLGAGGALSPRPRDGQVRLTSGPLSWRGRELGALRADLEIEGGVARARTLQLTRPDAGEGDAPLVQVTGTIPLRPGAPGLDARVQVAPAPLSFFTGALRQGRDALGSAGALPPVLERAVTYVDRLPAGTTGQVALDAALSGTLNAPHVRVTSLTLRDGRTRVPAGGFSPPATLDAAFTYDAGAVTIERAEFRLQKSAAPRAEANGAGADDDEDDTLLRVEPGGRATPGGPIELAADVFNANLSQLSTWVPALRSGDGAPLLRGELSEFSFRVGGTTDEPAIIGSVQAENLSYNSTTLDRLRVSRFEIGGGVARIEPGNLTLVKGAFQSSAAYGRVPWSWSPPGPVADGALDVHFPLQTREFGALAGVLVPSLAVADADEFSGSVDVTGTLRAPQFSGALTLRGAQFRLDSQAGAGVLGVRNVAGTLRFVGGTQLVIDADDPLRGQLVPASAIVGRAAHRVEIPGQPLSRPSLAAGGPNPKSSAKTSSPGDGSKLAGDWVLRGSVTRPDWSEIGGSALRAPAQIAALLRYDLRFSLDNGAYSAASTPGLSNLSVGAIWKTGPGAPQSSQQWRWMLAANGVKRRGAKNGGLLTSFGSLTLRSDFASGFAALSRARANDFSDEADFAALPVFKRLDLKSYPDRRAQVRFDDFAATLTGTGGGVVDGRLVLDNRAAVQKPLVLPRAQSAALALPAARPALLGARFESAFSPLPRDRDALSSARTDFFPVQDAEDEPSEEESPGETPLSGAPLRLGGTLTLENAELYGAGASGDGAALLLSRLPDAPRFDVRLKIGRDVQIVTAAFRAALDGEVVASGTPRAPQITGSLQTRDGQVRFPNARARVEEGRVSLAINRDAATDALRTQVEVDATARGQAGRYTITLHLRGPLDLGSNSTQNLKIDVTSDPPLSQNEAFAQLLGTVPTQQEQSDGTFRQGNANQAYARAVLQVLSAPLFSGVEQTLAQTLGLTSVGFEYRFNEPLAIQFTKALGDRVFVSYRRSLGSGPTSALASNNSNGRTPFELRIDYRIKGDYLLGLRTDERRIPSLTLQRTRRF